MSKSYYVKARGRVAGPFPVERLQAMARQGQLSRIHDVSTDGKNWQKASQFSELFQVDQPAAKPARETGSHAVAGEVAAKRKIRRQPAEADGNAEPPPSDKGGWHYGINGQSAGPVAESVIVDLIQRGKLTVRDRVWKATFDDWKTVGELPQLAVLLPGDGPNGQNSDSRASNQANGSDWDVHRQGIAKSLAAIVPWLYFICILIALYCFAMVYAFITQLALAYRLNSASLVGQSIGILLGIVTIACGGYFLHRFASFSSKYVLTEDTEFLQEAVLWLKRFWRLVGIALVAIIVVSTLVYAYIMATIGSI